MINTYTAIGVMSGTSLDGIDLACCTFVENKGWSYKLIATEFIPYSLSWKARLSSVENSNALDLALTDIDFGLYIAELCVGFIQKNKLNPELIASHGHTIFHQPEKKLTTQIGNGAAIAASTKIPVVCDFRTADVLNGGQGAPLVPVGDHYLFSEYDFCLNIGGFANISFVKNNNRIAFDICGANIVLNKLCETIGLEFDNDGKIARENKIDFNLLNELNNLQFYQENGPKSLGKEWIIEEVLPILESSTISTEQKIATYTEHIAFQISRTLLETDIPNSKLLITGGGAFNAFLLQRIDKLSGVKPEPASEEIIAFKEAIVFAFLGVLRWRGEINCLKSVTGANKDVSGGCIYLP